MARSAAAMSTPRRCARHFRRGLRSRADSRSVARQLGSVRALVGRCTCPRSRTSRKPSVVRKATFGNFRVMIALSSKVLAWLKVVLPSTPSWRAPWMTALAGWSWLLGTLATSIRPSSTETMSVKVPPMSTPSMPVHPVHRSVGRVVTSRTAAERRSRTRGPGVRLAQAGHCWHLRTCHHPPSLRKYSARAAAPHSAQRPSTAARSAYRCSCRGRGNE